jgi:hypothetical protein
MTDGMKQIILDTTGFDRISKRTRKREFLEEMNLVVSWSELVALIAPHALVRNAKGGRPPFAVETMLHNHFLQQWFNQFDPDMKEALYDTALFCDFAGLDMGEVHLPDESTIVQFRHLLEAHHLSVQILATVNATLTARGLMLKQGTVVHATLIAAPTSTTNSTGTRDPEMHQTNKGNQWYHGMKAHAGVDSDSGLVYSVAPTVANAHHVTQAHARHPGETGADQGQHPGQGGTPVSGHQAPVRLCEGQVPVAGQDHDQSGDAVCTVQTVDGAQTTAEDGGAGMSGTEMGQGAMNGAENTPKVTFENPIMSSSGISTDSYRISGFCTLVTD